MADENQKNDPAEVKDQLVDETMLKVLWIVIPIAIGGLISMFSNFEQEIQVVIWCVMIAIAGFGVWSSNAKKIRKARERREQERWDKQDAREQERWDKLDKRFDHVDEQFVKVDEKFNGVNERFDKVDSKMQEQEEKQAEVNRTLLRNELVRMHREWVEEKGYITLEAHEYAEKTYMAYNAIPANGSGTKLWKDIEALPIEEHR